MQLKHIAEFNEPWALAVLPDGRLLITERSGQLILFNPIDQTKTLIRNIPKVAYYILSLHKTIKFILAMQKQGKVVMVRS